MRKRIAAGNWKMNLEAQQAAQLTHGLLNLLKEETLGDEKAVILAPPYPFIGIVGALMGATEGYSIAAQNVHQAPKGAYTGEVSASMLKSLRATYCIVGHSERRQYFGEKGELLARKIDALIGEGIQPIYCIGETLEQREAGNALDVLRTQISSEAFHLSAADFGQVVVAYEPIWAIGTGVTATPAQAQEVHAFLRGLILEKYGQDIANNTSILYGGSVKPNNAQELFAQPDIDGGLVGGASLKADLFAEIVKAL